MGSIREELSIKKYEYFPRDIPRFDAFFVKDDAKLHRANNDENVLSSFIWIYRNAFKDIEVNAYLKFPF